MTASTPFYLGDTDIDGIDPGEPQPWWTVGAKFWLGRPDQMMVELPSPNSYTANKSQGEAEFGLANGGSSGTFGPSEMRRYTIGWNRIIGRDVNVLVGFKKRRIFGSIANSKGPWVFVPPEDVNRLTLAQSLCGAANGVVEGWLVNGGTLAYDDTALPAIMPGGVMRWTPVIGGNALISGATGGTFGVPDLLHAAPYLPAMPHTVTWWALASGVGPTLTAHLVGVLADGTVIDDQAGATVSLSATIPTPITLTVDPMMLAGAQYPLPKLVVGGTVAGKTIALSNPLLSYTDQVEDFELGCGVPHVIWPVALGDQAIDPTGTRPVQMVLAETVDGAA